MARIGLKGLTYATLSSGGSGSACVYTGGATHSDMMISADVTMTRENVKLYADNHAVESANGTTGGTISLELACLTDTVKSKLLGCVVSGNVLTMTEDESPYVGFGYIVCEIASGTQSYKAYWYPKIQFGLDNDSARTKGEGTEFQTNTMTGEGRGCVSITHTRSSPASA